ncbi:G-protein coupled receptor 83-like [Oppia nitens]|uniref:G-protein coupled receptor 83-like n=1 Tax=Oppia nitens TaxID=1686743 RepID=UPI0023DB365F|nr:G-protein coupled receptor 83-like [Oppia nitens]
MNNSTDLSLNDLLEDGLNIGDIDGNNIWEKDLWKNITIITIYSLIFVVSLLGNSLVIYVIVSKRRMRTVTYWYIVNLTVADLLITMINLPFNTARIILENWPFGQFMCQFVPFIQVCSVYASTLTMCIIALDRHQAILYPFGKRLSHVLPPKISLPLIWTASGVLSLPHALFNQVVVYREISLIRCRLVLSDKYHSREEQYRQWLTLLTFVSQYVIPLSIAAFCYCKIAFHIHRRGIVGHSTPQQVANNLRFNRKTIKMLVLVLFVFAFCWLPLNVYHIVADFVTDNRLTHNFSLLIAVHWLAMSSVCYNPFIYSARNSYFREGFRSLVKMMCCRFNREGPDSPNGHNNGTNSTNTAIYLSIRRTSYANRKNSVMVNDNNINVMNNSINNKTNESVI